MNKSPGRMNRWLALGPLTLLYLALPLVIFYAGWLKPAYAVLSIIPLVWGGWGLARCWPVEAATFSRGGILFLAGFSFGLTAFAGIGAFAPQEFDWAYHNAVLVDCINQPWPVLLEDGPIRWPMVYYLGHYLPAAAMGKLGGYQVAQVTWWVWSALGVMLAGGWFARLTRLPVWIAAPVFFAFAGLVFIGNLLVQVLGLPDNYHGWVGFYPNEFWARMWQFPSHFWMLAWAPGQALAAWLSAGMFLSCPQPLRPLGFGFLFLCDLLWAPFSAVGLGLLAFFLVWREGCRWPVKALTPLLALSLPAGTLMVFYAAKISPDVAARFPKIPIVWFTRFQDAPPDLLSSVFLLLLFITLEFGILWALLRAVFPKGSGERTLADACGLALLCLLPVTVGYYSDLAMRACAVPWFGLALLAARAFMSAGLTPRLRWWLWRVILIGALTPLIQIGEQGAKLVTGSYDPNVAPKQVSAVVNIPADGFKFLGAQYIGSTNSVYWKYLAR
jgi:hypothetical protein